MTSYSDGVLIDLSTSDLWPQAAPLLEATGARADELSGSIAVHKFGASCADGAAVALGLGRSVALFYCSSTL